MLTPIFFARLFAFSAWGLVLCLGVFGDPHSAFGENTFLPDGIADVGWTTVRGHHLTGHSDEVGLADSWPDDGPPVLWTRSLGKGYSSIVASEGRVFTQYQTVAGQYVLCLDADTGQTIWQYHYGWAYEATGLYPGPRSTPTIHDRHVYFTTPDAVVACLDWDGNFVWQVDLQQQYGSRGTEFGYAASPIIVEHRLLLPLGGVGASMVALDIDTGDLIWKSGDHHASYTPAFPITLNNRIVVVGYLQHVIAGFDLQDGTELWQVNLSRGYDEHSAWPIYQDGHLWISAPFRKGSQLFSVSDDSIKLIQQHETMSNDVSSSVLVDGYIYGFDLAEAQSKAHRPSRGSFRCVDMMTGEIQWSNGTAKKRRSTDFQTNRLAGEIGHASVIVADEKLILLNDLGDVIMAAADPSEYRELARAQVLGGEIGWATPALHRGRLYVRNHSRIVCLYVGREERMPTEVAANAISLDEVSQQPLRDFSQMLGVEPEYAMDAPTSQWLLNWFFAIAITLAAALVAALIAKLLIGLALRHRQSMDGLRFTFAIVAIVLCSVTGTIASFRTDDFVFTWPGAVFVSFHLAMNYVLLTRKRKRSKPRLDLYSAAMFLIVCCCYFVFCRRLSLVTEWVFLCGFVAAIPTSLAARWTLSRSGWVFRTLEIVLLFVSFTAFYAGAVAILYWKYDISSY